MPRITMARDKTAAASRPQPIDRTGSSGSYHAGAPIPSPPVMRRGSTYRYQTFPTQPPKTPIERPTSSDADSATSLPSSPTSSEHDADETPLPIRQLLLLAYLSLCEQTALNSISPYLPEMVGSMPGIPMDQGGIYVGTLASAFALAQLSTNFLWGYASDLVGRKPVLLAGTFSLMCCFCLFGFCTQFWQMVVVHALMGMLNGNAACVPTVLGEVTDKSNQSTAFTYLPVIYSLGSITGPAVGGLLVGKILRDKFYYLAPNLVSAAVLATSIIAVGVWFEETLDDSEPGPGKPAWLERLQKWFSRLFSGSSKRRHSWSARWPSSQSSRSTQPLLSSDSSSSSSDDGDETTLAGSQPEPANKPDSDTPPIWHELLNRKTLVLLGTYLIFQLSNISFNSLYPIFAATKPPTGRGLRPSKIGIGLSIAGAATIIFQAFFFGPLRDRVGNLGTYRLALLGIALSMAAMPWVGYATDKPLFGVGSGKLWLYIEFGVILIAKNVCAVGGLSSVMLLITNSAPSHASLGTLNGVAQTLSALGRSIGPFVSGGLFTLSTGIRPKGEAFVWSLFGGLALAGWVGSLFIRGNSLESAKWQHDHPDADDSGDEAV